MRQRTCADQFLFDRRKTTNTRDTRSEYRGCHGVRDAEVDSGRSSITTSFSAAIMLRSWMHVDGAVFAREACIACNKSLIRSTQSDDGSSPPLSG